MTPEIPFDKMIQAAMCHGADFVDVFFEHTRQTSVVLDNHCIEQAASLADVGVGVRAVRDGHTAYGSSNELTKAGLLGLAREVGRTLMSKRARPNSQVLKERPGRSITSARRHPFGVELGEKCSLVTGADEVAWKIADHVRQVRIIYRDTVRRIEIASSDGFFARDEQVDTLFNVLVVATLGDVIQTGFESTAGSMGLELFDDTPPELIAERAARRAIKMLGAKPAPAGTMPVVISSAAGGTMVHEAVGHGLEGDSAMEGLSVYSGKIGEKVAGDLVSVIDDATIEGKRGSFTCDDEGSNAHNTVLIENGILKSYLTNREVSMRHSLPLTGNARRQSYGHMPIVRMTNTFIKPGKDDPNAILASTQKGLFVRKMGGGQVDTVNGDFVFEVQEGYLIEDGKQGEPVRGAMLIGNGPKVLSMIDMVGSDLGFSVGMCGKEGQEVPVSSGQPTIRIPGMVVGGTEKI